MDFMWKLYLCPEQQLLKSQCLQLYLDLMFAKIWWFLLFITAIYFLFLTFLSVIEYYEEDTKRILQLITFALNAIFMIYEIIKVYFGVKDYLKKRRSVVRVLN